MNKEQSLRFIQLYEKRMADTYWAIKDNPEWAIEECIYMIDHLYANGRLISRHTLNRLEADSKALKEVAISALK